MYGIGDMPMVYVRVHMYVCVHGFSWYVLVCVRVYVCVLLGHTREQLDNFGYHFLDAINSFFFFK